MDDEREEADGSGWSMSCVEAMVGATLALMTGHAQAECPTRRRLMALKVRSHLLFLSGHPDLSPNLRQVAAQVATHWEPMGQCTRLSMATGQSRAVETSLATTADVGDAAMARPADRTLH